MEFEIVIAVLATGLILIGGMRVIWRDYRGQRPPRKWSRAPQAPTESTSNPTQKEILLGDQN